MFYLDRQFLSHPCYLTRGRIKITCILCIGCIGSHVSTSSSDVGFFIAATSEHDVTLCKLDVNVKNRTAVAGSVDSLNLSRNPLKEKVLFRSKFYFENQMWLIKRYAKKVSIMGVWCG